MASIESKIYSAAKLTININYAMTLSIRQYIPKKTDFNDISQQQIKEIQYIINNRPGKKLNFYSPKEIFFLNLLNKVA